MNEYQNGYEREINLMDLMVYCLKQWRWILVAMILMAVLAGGYKYLSTRSGNVTRQEEIDEEIQEVLDQTKEDEAVLEQYKLVIERTEKDLARQEEYLNRSMLMKLDPNRMQVGVLSFHLEINENENEANALDVLLAAYRAYVTDGRMAMNLSSSDDEQMLSEIQYLLSFSNNGNLVSYMADGEATSWPKQNVMQIQISAPDAALCASYLEIAEKAIREYSQELQRELPGHTLSLLASTQSERRNSDIQSYQTTTLNTYTATFKNLKALKAEVDAIEKAMEASLEAKGLTEKSEPLVPPSPVTSAVKFAILGLVMGAFFMGFVFIMVYVAGGRIRSTESFEEEFGMKMVGRLAVPAEGKTPGAIDRFIYQLEEGAYGEIPAEEQMKIICANVKDAAGKEGVKKVMLAGTIAEKDAQAVCESLKKDIAGITFSSYKQLVFCGAALEEIKEYDAVLFIEKKGKSSAKLIREEKELVTRRGVKVLGTVVA
ncbi:MAG: hypothetical protein HFI38_10025 [Lachnospiraceae bacterium]|jgi:hypothetical protein|nr:hypothetical protein [Lachnospiraceae bacterium]